MAGNKAMSDMPETLPPFPVDDATLNTVEHALSARFDPAGPHVYSDPNCTCGCDGHAKPAGANE